MKTSALKKAFLFIVGFLLVGCAMQPVKKSEPAFTPVDLNPLLSSGDYRQKLDNVLVILDVSRTMGEEYRGLEKSMIAKDTVSRMNQTIPDIRLRSGLRALGQGTGSTTNLVYGMMDHSRAGFDEALMGVKGHGGTPLGTAIKAGITDLEAAEGPIAVIIFSDGKATESNVVTAAQAMKRQYGDRVCIYTVLVGDSEFGKDLMERIADAGGCGFSTTADEISSPQAMADFVTTVFLERDCQDSDGDGVCDDEDRCLHTQKGLKVDETGCPLDSDGDGVPNHLDWCPDTPRWVKVDSNGCPLDSDGDGVADHLDECPDTPKGFDVDYKGCEILGRVHFDFDKDNIKPQYHSILDQAVAFLGRNPEVIMEIHGHTDNEGTAAYNQKLSERRAGAVLQYLVEKGIDKDRFFTVGHGFTQPIETNRTKAGRAMNRRAELQPIR